MKANIQHTVLSLLLMAGAQGSAFSQTEPLAGERVYKQAIDFSPISPMFNIYAIQYHYAFDEKNSLILDLAYSAITHRAPAERQPEWMDAIITPNTQKEDVGRTHSPSLILGYKRYLWRNLHVEYRLWPSYDGYYGSQEKK